jgi:nucleotide-binding universal stress UspA family protein
MKKQTKILVPVDFSLCSENALRYAFFMADKIDATIEILHVAIFDTPPLDYPSFTAVATDEKIKMARTKMNETTERVRKRLGFSPDIETDIEVGIPDTKIVEVAVRDNVDLIIMGTQGENSVWDKFLGSTTADVLKYVTCPVLVIPEKARFRDEMVIGYATDFLAADPFEIWKASKLFQSVQSKVIAVHLNDKKEYLEEKIAEMETFFAENAPTMDISFHCIFTEDMVEDLNVFIDNHNISTMVMFKPKRNFFERLFHKSFTKTMAMKTEVPLLILNEK